MNPTQTEPSFEDDCASLVAHLLSTEPPPQEIVNDMLAEFSDQHGLDFRRYTTAILTATPVAGRMKAFIGLTAIRVLLEEVATPAGVRFRLRQSEVAA